ncbi:hypothetical protein [Pimelobacter simplex]|uniref:hypothetical protein n=1 Tax=Nocardioides simplex TaxID=2045 RepID=UPI0021506A46|nr:hypothetical protein [Pimelobacter simplex]UUW88653.1 hypothetical protein M0M43_23355 [Pimelobacter simplex]UUW98158.1 hypothetical protein M0M48_12005 [Pimelobacter simplex]
MSRIPFRESSAMRSVGLHAPLCVGSLAAGPASAGSMALAGCPSTLSAIVGLAAVIGLSLVGRPVRLVVLRAALVRGGVPEHEAANWSFRAIYYPGSPDPTLTTHDPRRVGRRQSRD